nr:MaoC family dehydratase [Elioraea sp.]
MAAGQVYRSASAVIDGAAITAFAAAWDPQPFHLDSAAASASIFGGLAASGWHTACHSMRLFVDGPLRIAGGLVGAGVEQLRWPVPTRPGDILHVETEVLSVRPSASKPDRGLVRIRNVTLNQRGEVAQEMIATLVVPRRDAGGQPAGP